MEELALAHVVLKDIITNDTHFQATIKKIIIDHQNINRSIISALVGCELRHHLVFDLLISIHFPNLEKDDLYFALLLGLANNLFAKRIERDEILKFILTFKKEFHSSLDDGSIINFFENIKDSSSLIPNNISPLSIEFKAYRYNTPIWLVKMWLKHYGHAKTLKILKANQKSQKIACFVNLNYTNVEEVIKNENFHRYESLDNVVIYDGKAPLRKNEFLRNFDVFTQKLAISDMLNQLNLPKVLDALIYAQDYSTLFVSFVSLYKKENLHIELAVPSLENRMELLRIIKLNKLDNVHLFASNPSTLIAHLHDVYPYVFAIPYSSNFDAIRSQPDFLLHFKKESLDALIANQINLLEELATFVSNDGYLIYFVPTLSKKEGSGIIRDFLSKHSEFSLEVEKEYFPYDKFDTCFYFAKLKRETRHD